MQNGTFFRSLDPFRRRAAGGGLFDYDRSAFRRTAIRLTLAVWFVQHVVLMIGGLIGAFATFWPLIASRALFTVWGLVLTLAILLVLERLQHRSLTVQMITALAICAPAGAAQVLVSRDMLRLVGIQVDPAPLAALVPSMTYWMWFYFAWSAGVLAIGYSIRAREEQRLRNEAQALAHRAQMQALRYQLNPHFLFNTLNSIAALVLDGRAAPAERMIRKLSTFLRSGLASDPLADIPLETEISQQSAYLDIERERFPDRLSVEIDVPPELCGALVPSFILQPLVENAIKHGVAPSLGCATIGIRARAKADRLLLTVSNSAPGEAPGSRPGTGIGLRNVQNRLASRFPGNCELRTASLDDGFQVDIDLPLRSVNT